MYEENGHIKADTSPYAYMGYVDDPYNVGNGGMLVDNFNDWDVRDFCDDPDSLFGRNKKKKAEKKLKKAEKKLAKGNTRAANRKIKKAQHLLDLTAAGQARQGRAIDTLSQVNQTQAAMAKNLEAAQQEGNPTLAPTSLSTQPMSTTASSLGSGGGSSDMSGLTANSGVESEAPDNSSTSNDEPIGRLADTKEMPNVTVTGKKMNILLVLIVAVLVIGALVYFSKKRK